MTSLYNLKTLIDAGKNLLSSNDFLRSHLMSLCSYLGIQESTQHTSIYNIIILACWMAGDFLVGILLTSIMTSSGFSFGKRLYNKRSSRTRYYPMISSLSMGIFGGFLSVMSYSHYRWIGNLRLMIMGIVIGYFIIVIICKLSNTHIFLSDLDKIG